jgi:xanthine dehydrogenase small subunit
MSAFALKHHNAEPTHHEIDLALGGNLCRCTGYGPIVKAVEQSECKGDQYDKQAKEISAALNEIAQSESTAPSFLQPRNLESFFGYWRNHPNARIIAGGTDLMLEVTQQLKPLPVMISTLRVEELQELSLDSGVLTIGAGVSLTRLYDFANEAGLHAIVYLLERFAAKQIRNRATVGGSVANASPIGDLAPILLALNAEVDIVSAKEQRSLPVEQFFKGYRVTDLKSNEIIQRFKVPFNHFKRVYFEKVSKRMDDDISAVAIALAVTIKDRAIEGLSVGLGGVAATPYKLETTCQKLCGSDVATLSATQIESLLSEEISPMSDLRATAAYRLTTAANLIHAMLCDAAEEV